MEEIKDLIKKGKWFDGAGKLVGFIVGASKSELLGHKSEIKELLINDLAWVYSPPSSYIPGASFYPGTHLNESVWVLEQKGVTDKLLEAGILTEIAELLLKKAVEGGRINEARKFKKVLRRDLSKDEIFSQLLVYANSYQYEFYAKEELKCLATPDQKEIIRRVVKRAVTLGWWRAIETLIGVSNLEEKITEYIISMT